MSGEGQLWTLAPISVCLLIVLGFYVNRIDQRIRVIKLRQERLSLTFLKIENDLTAIQDCLLIMSKNIEESFDAVAKIRNRRSDLLKSRIESGLNSADLLCGLEFPDLEEDPAFWSEDRMKKLGLERSEAQSEEELYPK